MLIKKKSYYHHNHHDYDDNKTFLIIDDYYFYYYNYQTYRSFSTTVTLPFTECLVSWGVIIGFVLGPVTAEKSVCVMKEKKKKKKKTLLGSTLSQTFINSRYSIQKSVKTSAA